MRRGRYRFRTVWRLGASYQSWREGDGGPVHRSAELALGYWHLWIDNAPREAT